MNHCIGMFIDSPERFGHINTTSMRQRLSRDEAILESEAGKFRYTALRRCRGVFRQRSAFQEYR